MGGATSTESAPLLGLFLDEVRRMQPLDITLARQRISHSPFPIDVKISTAGYPDQDIAYWFARTDQRHFYSACHCPDGIALAEEWPDCISLQPGDVFYRCPRCDTRIANPQVGRYVAHAPERAVRGYHIPQTLSLAPLHSPGALWDKWTNPQEDRGEFYRSVLGRPYVDPEAQLVTADDLKACVNPDLQWEREGRNCALGLDHMGGWLDVVILAQAHGEKLRLVHVERIEGDDPFGNDDAARHIRGRLDDLMHRYDVRCAVSDLNPNYNEVLRFSQRWKPRAFLVTYSSSDQADMIVWRDQVHHRGQQGMADEVKFTYTVTIQRYKALDYALGLFTQRQIALPHPRGLTQTVHDDHGVLRPVFMGEEMFWPHMQRIVRQKHILNAEQGTYKMEMVKVGADPHYAFAFMYAVVAASRVTGGAPAILHI
jgi:hypothetical protein